MWDVGVALEFWMLLIRAKMIDSLRQCSVASSNNSFY
jgi:hypothetical protein